MCKDFGGKKAGLDSATNVETVVNGAKGTAAEARRAISGCVCMDSTRKMGTLEFSWNVQMGGDYPFISVSVHKVP